MARNLLPRLRSPANIPLAKVGEWTVIPAPADLAKLEHSTDRDADLRRRVQSVPNPWARLLLFHNALQDPDHPARGLVENELLDALEFVWQTGPQCEFVPIRLDALGGYASFAGSARVDDFAAALAELAPTKFGARTGLEAVTIALLAGKPIFASSPYTLLFTAEDAAVADTGHFFRYASGEAPRRLAQRPPEFQRYVAQVLMPQLTMIDGAQADAGEVQRCVKPWMEKEIRQASEQATDAQLKRDLIAAPSPDWRASAEALGIQDYRQVGGLTIYTQRPGAQLTRSSWRLRCAVPGAPIVVHPAVFDGIYFSGAARITLPSSLGSLPKDHLPGLGVAGAWVNPELDWLTSELLLISDPLMPSSVQGFRRYQVNPGAPAEFTDARMMIPLKGDFFRFFRPEDVDELLSIQVLNSGDVEVTLQVPIGAADRDQSITVRKVYAGSSIKRQVLGPNLAVWPSFKSPSWHQYAVFRHDGSSQMARYYKLVPAVDGIPLPGEQQEWTPTTSVLTTGVPPEALEILRVSPNGAQESMGVLLPKYAETPATGNLTWNVGVDFGTSNTVVSVKEGAGAAALLNVSNLVLPLTRAAGSTDEFLKSYFLPGALEPRPFATALVCVRNSPTRPLAQDPLGLRANIPVTGRVQAWETTQVVGDLKWTARAHDAHLPATFIRQVIATVLAAAVQRGVPPSQVKFSWAYPRAFSAAQRSQLEGLWAQALDTFSAVGVSSQSLTGSLDESQSALQHFFNAGVIAPAQDLTAIVDVGGGTSDIAVYGHNRPAVLDSVMLGGRNLTGRLLQGETAAAMENPFARAFLNWAESAELPDDEQKIVRAYRIDQQEHLAFSYLIGTRWFAVHRTSFIAEEAHHAFQLTVLYFFGAIGYYLGLTLRAPDVQQEFPDELPFRIILAGNGSRYLHWLTDFQQGEDRDVFRRVFARLVAAGARASSSARLPTVEFSLTPKEEVARGLIAAATLDMTPPPGVGHGSVVGENVELAGGPGQTATSFAAESRFSVGATIQAGDVQRLRWLAGESEIERYHNALIEASGELAARGQPWPSAGAKYMEHFHSIDIRSIQHDAANRLQYLATIADGFQGSLFILEASVTLESLLKRLFR